MRIPWAVLLWLAAGASTAAGQNKDTTGTYVPGAGFRLVNTEKGALNFKLYTYVRYINQDRLDDEYTDGFGNVRTVDSRQDIQLQKVNLQFLGWLLSPKFRYIAYVWTSNASQGLTSSVVVAGNLSYAFNRYITLGAGIGSLPGSRDLEGNFPYWLSSDNRLIADEYFRPSYTSGIWINGAIVNRLTYRLMLGNNMSQLGVDAGQLDDGLNTLSGALVWLPTTGEFGKKGGFGDFDDHQAVATRLGAHFTRSNENFQGQPNTDAFENVTIRLSDGSVIFEPGLFGQGVRITDARYRMAAFDAGIKYRGFALEGEYYERWVDNFQGPGTEQLAQLRDHGFQLQASAMVIRQTLQAYVSGSKVYGEYGNPSDARVGINWYPFKLQVMRWNAEYLHLNRSPVGSTSHPYLVGGNGGVFYTSFEVDF